MADGLTAARAAQPVPAVAVGADLDDVDVDVLGTFDDSRPRPRLAPAGERRLRRRPARGPSNVAVGVVPWGPDVSDHREVVVHPGDALDLDALGTGPLLVLGRDVHRHPEARATVDRLRATRDVLVVDLGWPSRDHAYADVATYGASRRVGRALRAWIALG